MNPVDGTASPKTQDNNVQGATAPSDMDLQAINQAITASANEAVQEQQNSFDVNSISLDNTPTSDAELKAQMDKDPNMSLAGSTTSPSAAPAAAPQPSAPSGAAGFVDGDLQNEPDAEPKEPVSEKEYSARAADPVDSFDENSPAMPTDIEETKTKDGEEKDDPESKDGDSEKEGDKKNKAKKEKSPSKSKSIDASAIAHNNFAVIAIVVVVIVVIMGIVLALSLKG